MNCLCCQLSLIYNGYDDRVELCDHLSYIHRMCLDKLERCPVCFIPFPPEMVVKKSISFEGEHEYCLNLDIVKMLTAFESLVSRCFCDGLVRLILKVKKEKTQFWIAFLLNDLGVKGGFNKFDCCKIIERVFRFYFDNSCAPA